MIAAAVAGYVDAVIELRGDRATIRPDRQMLLPALVPLLEFAERLPDRPDVPPMPPLATVDDL